MAILDNPSNDLEIIYLPAMLQWPKDSCYVANTLFLQYKWDTNLVYFWPGIGKEKLPKRHEIPIISAGGKTLLFLPLVDGTFIKKQEAVLTA